MLADPLVLLLMLECRLVFSRRDAYVMRAVSKAVRHAHDVFEAMRGGYNGDVLMLWIARTRAKLWWIRHAITPLWRAAAIRWGTRSTLASKLRLLRPWDLSGKNAELVQSCFALDSMWKRLYERGACQNPAVLHTSREPDSIEQLCHVLPPLPKCVPRSKERNKPIDICDEREWDEAILSIYVAYRVVMHEVQTLKWDQSLRCAIERVKQERAISASTSDFIQQCTHLIETRIRNELAMLRWCDACVVIDGGPKRRAPKRKPLR